jgi:hypothetical protein
MAFIVLHGTGFIVALLFQCTPINSIWNRNVTGKCINLEAIGFAGAAGSIFEDLVILVLPVSELKDLSLGTKRRLSLVFMFSIGSL